MLLVASNEPGVVELNFMWLPTFIGINTRFKEELQKELAPKFEGRQLDDTLLLELHDAVLDAILKKFPFPGLRDYLDAIKFVTE